jgi:hypothetical protein
MNGIRRAGEVLLGVLFAMVATASAAMAKGYIELDSRTEPLSPRAVEGATSGGAGAAPLSPRAVEGATSGGGGGGGQDVTTVIEQGYSVMQLVLVAAVTAALAFAIGFLAQRTWSGRHRPQTAG